MTAFSTPHSGDAAAPAHAGGLGTAEAAGGARAERYVDVFETRIVLLAASGCSQSFRLLVERHQEAVFRFCLQWLGSPEDAREACQDTFVRAHAALGRFEPRARFSTWLYRIALNLCRDRVRSRRFRVARTECPLDEAGHRLASSAPAPDEAAATASELARLECGLRELPRRLREALVLHGVHGLSLRECAEILGCTERAVEGRLYRARRRLAAWYRARP